MRRHPLLLAIVFVFIGLHLSNAQEEDPYISIDIPSQNMLKFNRFLINPTFSTVKETKSYFNLFHRSEWDNSNKTYLGSYSGRINDRTGLGLSVYHQKFGVISNFGLMGNYTYGVRLSENVNMHLGVNLSYYNSGFDRSEAQTVDIDPIIQELNGNSLLSVQPGFNLAIGNFDVGIYAENLVDFNLNTGESVTEFNEKTFSGHLMYTREIANGTGLMKDGRYSILARARMRGDDDISPSASFILDLPVGWFQTGYDDYYGASAGVGFNISKRISIGYVYEKGLKNPISNFGSTHEINFAYSFQPHLTDNMVLQEEEDNVLLEEKLASLAENEELEEGDTIVVENDTVIVYKSDETAIADLIEKKRDAILGSRDTTLEKKIIANKDRKRQYVEKYMDQIAEKAKKNPQYQQQIAELKEELDIADQPETLVAETNPANIPSTGTGIKKRSYTKTESKPVIYNKTNKDNKYLVIANVFKDRENSARFIEQMQSKGMNARSFSKNGLHYVYLDEYSNWTDASVASENGLNGRYNDKTWVLRQQIDNSNNQYGGARDRWTNAGLMECTKENIERLNSITFKGFRGHQALQKMLDDKMKNGYYLIANVFSEHKNASRFIDQLRSMGIEAHYFVNPNNNYSYVYLNQDISLQSAKTLYNQNKDKEYAFDLWIMHVKT
ncbi:PorP/SprF family type IX secretion system membrane protein [Zhouia spongiae]|uniref:PorP/SprF family type IX secretion system membrane protein n=1 Tax=Zhouia spongiae TaxID=2202721 RepID=A0ABY3YQE0_9FLAO|nr:PorP/SprF family type IX secretion system membrane protein [Zhouia spongiae]UNY99711.1 PorP/SprF family type IX secretion system membrane protein [Zhouia spongiae]